MASSTNIRITSATTSRNAFFVIDTGYITSRLGLLKLLLSLFSLICLILILVEAQKAACGKADRRNTDGVPCYKIYTGDLFLLLISFCHLYIVFLMLITSLMSIGNSSLLPKTTFDHAFHFVACGLYLIGGLWVLIDSASDGRTATIVFGSLFALLCSFGHFMHGMYSYQKSLLI